MPILNSHEEAKVISWGYPYVSTNSFAPWGELPKHWHTDPSTHLIVSGSITMTDYGVGGHRRVRLRSYLGKGNSYDVPAHISYGGRAGPEGVVFVEGRTCISPGLDYRMRGLDTPANLERPPVPIHWHGERATRWGHDLDDDEYESDMQDACGISQSPVDYRYRYEYEWDGQGCRTGRVPVNNHDNDDRGSPARSTWAWLWRRYWYGIR